MATSENQQNPIEFAVFTAIAVLAFTLVLGMLTAPALLVANGMGSSELGFALLALLVYSFYITANAMTRDREQTDEDGPLRRQIALISIAILFYNLIILASIFVSVIAATVFGPAAGVIAALMYPVWDIKTTQLNIPFSLGGLVAFMVWILGTLGALGSHAVSELRDVEAAPIKFIDRRIHGGPGKLG